MGKQEIIQRIISDAETAAAEIISEAEKKAAEICDDAQKSAERRKKGTQAEIDDKVKSICDGKSATARLDGAKALLAEKRRVIDETYNRALDKLNALPREDALRLAERLLSEYSEQGDEIVFAANYKYAQQVAKLSVVGERKLKISSETANVDGGFILCGKTADKDVSYGALIAADREEFQAGLAAEIF